MELLDKRHENPEICPRLRLAVAPIVCSPQHNESMFPQEWWLEIVRWREASKSVPQFR